MLQTISWSVFLTSLLCLASAYWLFIGVFFYSTELKQLLSGKKKLATASPNTQNRSLFLNPDGPEENNFQPALYPGEDTERMQIVEDNKNTPLFPVAYRLVEELRRLIKEAAAKKSVREELVFSLQGPLNQEPYTALKNTPFKVAVNNLIEMESESQCAIRFSAEELNLLWKKL